jgi:hypothetical protein
VIKDLSFDILRETASQGCDLCSLIHDGLLAATSASNPSEQLKDDTSLVVSIMLERCHPDLAPVPAQCTHLMAMYSNGDVDDQGWFHLTLASEGNGQYVSGTRLDWNPSLWCSWMDDCINKHRTCGAVEHNGYAPTRLVDIGCIDTPAKLIEPNRTPVEYIALSHCWGGSLPLRTTTVNLRDHFNTIPLEALPSTFQDAVKITRSMGYRYLWIDCLCITQDSEQDWLRECALMGKVYAGAVLTIAAERSESPSDGLFKMFEHTIQTCSIPICWASTGKSDVLIIGLPPRPRVMTSMRDSPLSARGWALQERVLSRRVLHVCESATFFVCSCSESVDIHRWPVTITHSHYQMTRPHKQDAAQSLRHWYRLVSDYTERKLTYARDRLPAISGVARIISERFGWTYVAGLWTHDLEAALLWGVYEPDTPLAINPTHYNGPSWSWASADRPLYSHPASFFDKRSSGTWIKDRESLSRLQKGEWVSHYKVQHFSVELAGDDPFAEVTAGQLTIIGNMRPIPRPTVSNPPPAWGQSQPFAYSPGTTVDIYHRPDQTTPERNGNAARTWCLLAGFDNSHFGKECYALVLQAVPGSTCTFRRIGMMIFSCSTENGERWHEAVDWLLGAESKQIYLV